MHAVRRALKAFGRRGLRTTPRLRFAPSPTGFLHLGSLRTALFNRLIASQFHGDFFVRLEDTDRERLVDGSVEQMLSALEWCGVQVDSTGLTMDSYAWHMQHSTPCPPDQLVQLPSPLYSQQSTDDDTTAPLHVPVELPTAPGECDDGPFVQSLRLPAYRWLAHWLVAQGHAYPCFCSAERLDALRARQQREGSSHVGYDGLCAHLPPHQAVTRMQEGDADRPDAPGYVIRARVLNTRDAPVSCVDALRGEINVGEGSIGDYVLLKSDHYPTYHLANVVDDAMMGVTHVVRGEEWLPSLGKHTHLYRMFGWAPPVFMHLPLLLNEQGQKLSKRHSHASVCTLQEQGYTPEALVNFVALLGWSPHGARNNENANKQKHNTNNKNKKEKNNNNDNNSSSSSEIFLDMDALSQAFDLRGLGTDAAQVAPHKLDWIQTQHTRTRIDQQPLSVFAQALPLVHEYLRNHCEEPVEGVSVSVARAVMILRALREKVTRVPQVAEYAAEWAFAQLPTHQYASQESTAFAAQRKVHKALHNPNSAATLRALREALPGRTQQAYDMPSSVLPLSASAEDVAKCEVPVGVGTRYSEACAENEEMLRNVREQAGLAHGQWLLLVRYTMTGLPVGPGVASLLSILTEEQCVARIDYILERYFAG